MDIGNNNQPAPADCPQRARAKDAAIWFGHVAVAQIIGYFVRHWLP